MKIINFFTPTAHGEDILADTIESIQKQTYPSKQTIMTDNEEAKQNVIKMIASLKPKRTLHYHLQENVTEEFHRPEPLLSGFVHLVKYDYWKPKNITNTFVSNLHYPIIHPNKDQIIKELQNDYIEYKPKKN